MAMFAPNQPTNAAAIALRGGLTPVIENAGFTFQPAISALWSATLGRGFRIAVPVKRGLPYGAILFPRGGG